MSSDAGSPTRALSDVSQRELRELARAIDAGWVSFPVSTLGLANAGLAPHRCTELAALLAGFDARATRTLLDVALAERVYRPPPRLDLVWTGPEARGTTARDTSIVVQQLFGRAKESVIIGGFRFDAGSTLFAPLHKRMQDGLTVDIFVDIDGTAPSARESKAFAERVIDRFVADNWPFGPPHPAIYYDLQSAVPGPPWVSLHAKCIVVDEAFSFVTSANFTNRGQTRNIEVGVCIEDRDFAERLSAQWRALISRGLVERWGG